MDIQDLQTLVERRHSVRGYDESREISDETVRSILDCALGADGGNGAWFGFAVALPFSISWDSNAAYEVTERKSWDRDRPSLFALVCWHVHLGLP